VPSYCAERVLFAFILAWHTGFNYYCYLFIFYFLPQGIKFKHILPPSVNEIVEASAMDAQK